MFNIYKSRIILDNYINKKFNSMNKVMKEIDDCAKNTSIDDKIKIIMKHSFNTRDDGELMTYEDWIESPEDVEQVFDEMVDSLKITIIFDSITRRYNWKF